ncbi:MAG TPA: ABC transporter [Thiotrichaceae bacterium]|jgi:hypothetical protein|nr:ABC transporter [Thiotrichaceae bacterium]HIM07174.1 ABC transporter [Gammaproteobacteria bacterium]
MNYQLVIQFSLVDAGVEDFERLMMLENELRVVLREKHMVDGHDLGAEKMNIFINTDDPNEAFTLAKDVLIEADLKTILVAYRDFESEEYVFIWPEKFSGEFRIK